MAKKQLSEEQKRLETDIWIIALVTLGVFLFYAAMGNQLMDFVTDDSISVIPRLLLNAAVQFGIAGLGITIICISRKEKFTHFGLIRKKFFKAIIGTIICFIPWLNSDKELNHLSSVSQSFRVHIKGPSDFHTMNPGGPSLLIPSAVVSQRIFLPVARPDSLC